MVRAALALWDERQGDLGGQCSDAQSHDVLIAAVQGLTDAEAAEALGTGLARGCSYWVAEKPCPYGAGQLTAAARDQWFVLGPDDQTPDAPACVPWDAERGVFDDSDTAETFGHIRQQPVQAALAAPSALNREAESSPVAHGLIETATSAENRDEGNAPSVPVKAVLRPVEAPVAPPAPQTQPQPLEIIPVQHETRKSSIGMTQAEVAAERAKQLAALKASGLAPSHRPGRYGTALPDDAGCGQEYFDSLNHRSTTAVLDRDDDIPF